MQSICSSFRGVTLIAYKSIGCKANMLAKLSWAEGGDIGSAVAVEHEGGALPWPPGSCDSIGPMLVPVPRSHLAIAIARDFLSKNLRGRISSLESLRSLVCLNLSSLWFCLMPQGSNLPKSSRVWWGFQRFPETGERTAIIRRYGPLELMSSKTQ